MKLSIKLFSLLPLACLALCLTMLSSPARAGPAEDKLLACMRANIPTSLRIQEFELTSTDRNGGKRQLKGRLFAKREDGLLRAMLRLTAPADVNGSAYLMREGKKSDEMYVFLPALNRVRRINGGAAGDGPLFGTDISYADVKQLQNAFDGSLPVLDGTDKIEGRPARILAMTPLASSGSRYSRIRTWVDEASCLALKVEFLEANAPRKRLLVPVASIAKSGNYWYAGEIEMSDLKAGTRTQLKVTGVKSGEDVANRYFDSRNFYLGG